MEGGPCAQEDGDKGAPDDVERAVSEFEVEISKKVCDLTRSPRGRAEAFPLTRDHWAERPILPAAQADWRSSSER